MTVSTGVSPSKLAKTVTVMVWLEAIAAPEFVSFKRPDDTSHEIVLPIH